MRLVFAGTPEAAWPSLEALVASERHEVVAVVSRPDAPAGRGRGLAPSVIKSRAVDLGLPVLTPARPSEPEFVEALRELAPDCCPVVAYGALVPPQVLEIPTVGWVNLHFSILPAWRGAAPVQRSILAGDDLTGATTFLLEAGMDTGPVFGVMTTEIGNGETAGELMTRLSVDGAKLLVDTLDGIESGELSPVPQPLDGISYAAKLTVDDAHIAWGSTATQIDRQIRACTPTPGAWTTHRGRRLGIGPVEVMAASEALSPGQLRDLGKLGIAVGTGSHPVLLGEVQPEGKPAMAAAAWARGARLQPGESLT